MSQITVSALINSDIDTVWQCLASPSHIQNWNNASPDWHCPKATNELVVGGRFCYNMAARDGSIDFDFAGIFVQVEPPHILEYVLCETGTDPLASDRRVRVLIASECDSTVITQTFDPENQNSEELQKQGWQSILNNFKRYVESLHNLD
jgi:uncharacterized protein YndB with AHSA1/START domain